jgi:hypothetical protein
MAVIHVRAETTKWSLRHLGVNGDFYYHNILVIMLVLIVSYMDYIIDEFILA